MNTVQLLDYAELAFAGYGQFNVSGRPPQPRELTTLNRDTHGFSDLQSKRFGERFEVAVSTFEDATSPGGSGRTSFDTTVFRRLDGADKGKIFISFRGTGQQDVRVFPNDIASALQNGSAGAAISQIVQMYNWWQRVSTSAGEDVPQYFVPTDRNAAVRINDAKSTGELRLLLDATPGAKVTVTGSSLGGHLAMAFAALFPESTQSAVAFNSPGFGGQADLAALFSTLGGRVPDTFSQLITNVVSSQANNAAAQWSLIPGSLIAGYPGDSFPGRPLTVPIENQFLSDVPDPKIPSWNHDQRQVTDSLTVFSMLEQLDTTLTLDRFGGLLRASAEGETRSLESLVDAVESLLGINQLELISGNTNRDALHAAVQAIVGGAPQSPEPNAAFKSLAGHVQIQQSSLALRSAADSSFGAVVAMQELSPFWVSANDAAGNAALGALWGTTRAADYDAWLAGGARSTTTTFTSNWIDDRSALLNAVGLQNTLNSTTGQVFDPTVPGNKTYQFSYVGGAVPRDETNSARHTLFAQSLPGQASQIVYFGTASNEVAQGNGNNLGDHLYGGAGNDSLDGLGGSDYAEGNAGDDALAGGAGNDTLLGGIGTDSYQFDGGFGRDIVIDADGQGSIRIDSQAIGSAEGVGKRDAWVFDLGAGQYAGLAVYEDAASSTGKRLVVTRDGDSSNTITIDNFDLVAAQGNAGYLGIRLDGSRRIILKEGAGPTPWSDLAFDPASLAGLASSIVEGTGRTFTLYLDQAAATGDTITLGLSSLGDSFQAFVGSALLGANGAVIALEQGQTQVSFMLLQVGPVGGDAATQLSAAYAGAGQGAASNTWGLNLKDTGSLALAYTGDQRARLIGSETQPEVAPGNASFGTYAWGETSWAANGSLTNGKAQAGFADVIYATGNANDRLAGLTGNDALDGGAGNDEIDGGAGDDLIAGGAGSDRIFGGAGNDYINSSGALTVPQRRKPDDSWSPPAGQTIKARGPGWGIYLEPLANTDSNTVWDSAGLPAGADGDYVDAGDGDDGVVSSAGVDHLLGGSGQDTLDGMGGDDLLEGNDGNDLIQADGVVQAGRINSVDAALHGDDFVDAGSGNDTVKGGGRDDVLFGGAGNDQLWGDVAGRTGDPDYLALAYHGSDDLDGADGDDSMEGGGKDDSLRGGAGHDTLWGDTGADNISGASDNALLWGNDDLQGDAGDDRLVGGGGNDSLYGGANDDQLWGDESNAALAGKFNGSDYLDGEDGNDLLLGGGRDDILYGGSGNDSLWGDDEPDKVATEFHGDDHLDGGAGADLLAGGGGNDTLLGGAGNDTLSGGSGANQLVGGAGDDLYLVDSADDRIDETDSLAPLANAADLARRDSAWSAAGLVPPDGRHALVAAPQMHLGAGSLDQVQSSVSYTLGPNLENLTLTGNLAIDATGNARDNLLIGNSANNVLDAGAGNDLLLGGTGADTLIGGGGDDGYEVDDRADTVVEAEDAGLDFVLSHVSFVLPDHVEQLRSTGSAAIALTGNALANSLFGNAGNNLLAGGTGNDYLAGDGGDDVYLFNRGDGQDVIDNTDILLDAADTSVPGASDTLRFGEGILEADLIGLRSGNDLYFKIRNSTDRVGLLEYFGPDIVQGSLTIDHRIDRVAFASAAVWDQARIAREVARAAANRAPESTGSLPQLQARAGDAFAYTVPAGTFTDPDAGDPVYYSVAMQDGSAAPQWLAFDSATRSLSGTPDAASVGSLPLVLWGSDDYGAATGKLLSMRVGAPNHAPQLLLPSPDQQTVQFAPFSYSLPASAFTDPDPLDPLGYGATLPDGSPLPSWLTFHAPTRTFSGAPESVGSTSVLVVASDSHNASAIDLFDIVVEQRQNHPPELVQPLPDQPVSLAAGFSFTLSDSAFVDPDAGDVLRYSATLADGSTLPPWLGFDPPSRTFSGSATSTGRTSVRVLAHDREGLAAADQFDIVAQPPEIMGTAGADMLLGGAGDELILGLAGSDTLHGGAGNDTLQGDSGYDILYGDEGNDSLVGGSEDNLLLGGAGNDTLSEGATMWGGFGNDSYRVFVRSSPASTYIYGEADGADSVLVSAGLGPGDVSLRRDRATDDVLLTNRLSGEYVSLRGQVTPAGAVPPIAEVRFEGASGTVWNAAEMRQMAITGDAEPNRIWGYSDSANSMDGAGGDDQLYGGDLGDTIDGGAGSDYLEGRGGNDTYLFGPESGHDRVLDLVGIGGNTIELKPGVSPESLRLLRTGQSGDDAMAANDSLVLLLDGTGARLWVDQFFQPGGVGSVGQIRFADAPGTVWRHAEIEARAGASLSGGADTQTGSTGDDHFLVDNGNDAIVEAPGGGTDSVRASVSYALPAEVENLELVGVLAVNGAGNASNNLLRGNDLDNTLVGNGGADQYYGGRGDDSYVHSVDRFATLAQLFNPLTPAVFELPGEGLDTLVSNGFALTLPDQVERLLVPSVVDSWYVPNPPLEYTYVGNALDNTIDLSGANTSRFVGIRVRIDGAAGNDTMVGNGSATTYVVDSTGDLVVEPRVNSGWVEASVSWVLGKNLLRLTLTGSAASGLGNALNNLLSGNSADNLLDGGAGADTLAGGAGDDSYRVDNPGDQLTELDGAGIDTVTSTLDWTLAPYLENLSLDGNAIRGTGNALSNLLRGNPGNNVLDGAAGADTLAGGDGDDSYRFSHGGGADHVIDSAGQDTLVFGAGLLAVALSASRTGSWVTLAFSAGDSISFEQTGTGQFTVETLVFADGAVWHSADLLQLLNAPATGDVLLNGNAVQNQTLGVGNTLADADGLGSIGYQWQVLHDDALTWSDLPGATGASLLLAEPQVGSRVRAVASYIDGHGAAESRASSPSAAVANVNDAPAGAVGVLGTALQNQLLSASNTLSDADGLGSIVYLWQSSTDGTHWTQAGAPGASQLLLTEAQVGLRLRVRASYTDAHGTPESVASDPSPVVANVNDPPIGAVGLAGGAVQGQTLAASNTLADADGLGTIGYQWQSSINGLAWSAIDGATASALLLTTALVGTRVRALASYVDGHGSVERVASPASAVVEAARGNSPPTGSITLLGGAEQNQTLTAHSTLADADGLGSISHQWQQSADGAAWRDIAGASHDQFTLSEAQVGMQVRTLGSYIDGRGTAEHVASLSSGSIANVNDPPTGSVTMSGFASQDQTLSAGNTLADVDGLGSIAYYWQATGDGIHWSAAAAAPADSLTLTAAHVGQQLRVVASYTDGHDSTERVASPASATVASASNLYLGTAGADSLVGSAGADQLRGLAGNDSYVVNHPGDVVTENRDEGIDRIEASVSYTIPEHVEQLTLGGSAALTASGNALDNLIIGNAGSNSLFGGAGADTLDGAAGADYLVGGPGDDSYVIDNSGDVLRESAAQGIDTVRSSIDYTLGWLIEPMTLIAGSGLARGAAPDGGETLPKPLFDHLFAGERLHVENLVLTGTATSATGNQLDNRLTGNASDNFLDGGAGRDSMAGGQGNDSYLVDDPGDLVSEFADEGIDSVQSWVSYALPAHVEQLWLAGAGSIHGQGNDLNNRLTGNGGANQISGNAGNDTLDGGFVLPTSDPLETYATYFLDNGDDDIASGNGIDSDTLAGGSGNDTYLFGRGYRSDVIQENDATPGNRDVLQFLDAVASDQIWLRRVANDLELSIIGSDDSATLSNWYLGSQYHVEQFRSSDGKTLLDAQVHNLVSAMAAFAPPPAGQTSLAANYLSWLAPTIAANWT